MKLLIIATFLAVFTSVMSMDCYDCQNCQIPFNNQTNTATCGGGITQCLKITAKLGTVYTYVTKQCGPCSNLTYLFGVTYLYVDCCTGNKCNGTNHIFLSKFLIFSFVVFFILNKKFNK